ncbi:MAG: clan AA aspartic protease [Candidatus Bathyarchaeia archaeon]
MIVMGKVVEKVKFTNVFKPEKSVEVEALIDTGATMASLPIDIVENLGLIEIDRRRVRYADNRIELKPVYGVVKIEIKERVGNFDVIGEVRGSQPLIGQVVLETLDLLVDPTTRKVIANPRSPDIPMIEQLRQT